MTEATKKSSAKASHAPAKEEASKASKPAPKASKPAAKEEAPKAAGNAAFAKPLKPSKELAAIVGADPLPRTEVVSKVWEYIKKNKLQNEANKREIVADDKLKLVFGRDKVTMFEMNKYLSQHLS